MNAKNFLQSKTIWGLILTIFGIAKIQFGWNLTEGQFENYLNLALEVGGLAYAAYGRWKATQSLKVS